MWLKKFSTRSISIAAITSALFIPLAQPSYADNANPPKVMSLEQVSNGPYTVGDIATFRINFTGGNPGIRQAIIEVAALKNICLSNVLDHAVYGSYVTKSEIIWYRDLKTKPTNPNVIEISGVVLPCTLSPQRRSVRIIDETGLSAGLSDGANGDKNPVFEILLKETAPSLLTPVGEIKPIKINDELSIKNLPAATKKGKIFKLPRLSKNGVPVYYLAENNRNSRLKSCYVVQNFSGDIGGTLHLVGDGDCRLTVMPILTDKFNYPTILHNKLKKLKTDPTHESYFVISVRK